MKVLPVEIASRINNQVLDWGFSIPRTAFEMWKYCSITGGIQLEESAAAIQGVTTEQGKIPTNPRPTNENLGDQTINGIHATGTRITITIPSGKTGNDKPIVVTSERWYSPI